MRTSRILVLLTLAFVASALAAQAPAAPAAPPTAAPAAAVPAAAPAAAAPAMPTPNPALAQLKYFDGTWHCKGQVFPGAMGPAHATTATVHAKWDLNDFWLGVRYAEAKTAANAHPYTGAFQWGYDGEGKRFISGGVGNMGDYATQASPGWEGDKLIFTGHSHGMGPAPLLARDTFSKKDANTFVHSGEYQNATGGWDKADEEECTRAK